jgi:hypothetical protein
MMAILHKQADLYLNGKRVGKVHVHGRADSWYFGTFEPADGFAEFATLFGEWSLLLHADNDRLSDAASTELRRIESAIDALRAELHLVESDRWVRLVQLNIDGNLVEWKPIESPPDMAD